MTAGRGPKGYTADVEITYPKSDLVSKFTAKTHDNDETSDTVAGEVGSNPPAVTDDAAPTNPATAGVASSNALFND